MVLKEITLENFRQFFGIQKIEFATANENKVTVIFGENGRGKTGLFRAIIYCLFGEKVLSQDGDVPKNEIKLINTHALQNNSNQSTKASVEVKFAHRGLSYCLKRTIHGIMDDGLVHEEDYDKSLSITLVDGNTKIINPADIELEINGILDRRVKDYFLFDGEKIERLTRSSIEQRREIGEGIRNLLNVDILEKSRRIVNKISKISETELSNSKHVELARTIKQINDNEDRQVLLKSELEQLSDELKKAKREIEKTDIELTKFNEIRHLIERRKILENQLLLNDQKIEDKHKEMPKAICKTALLMIAPTIINAYELIDQKRQRGEIPSDIKRDLIERILKDRVCICGNKLGEDSDSEKHIMEWHKRTTETEIQEGVLNLWRYLSDIKSRFSDDASSIEKLLQDYGSITGECDNIRKSLNNISDQIGIPERSDALKLDEHRKSIQDSVVRLLSSQNQIEGNLFELNQDKDRLEANLKDEKSKLLKNDELTTRSLLIRDTKTALDKIYNEFTDDIKTIISESATLLFNKLIDEETKNNFSRIIVNNDYSLEILDRYKKPFLANISAGQRQIMSLSFIAALAKAASKSDYIDFPLFMDTPFGRLSFEHRNNLINNIPDLTSQWILLATDTEFRKQEARLLLKTNKWGKFYMLKATTEGNTVINEFEINSAISLLNDEVG
jgi:DNA sulfur modification protein DndD